MTTDALDDTQPASRDSSAVLPSKISRFEIRSQLGAGGNGVVLLARDPALDRNVAIKILRRRGDVAASQRLLREAQSAAKLSHDAVIVVAMEYVPGGTLTTWQQGKPWRDVLDVYLRAGRGLAAAHAAGMVHRDFKPDNVLVGDDGRVRVTDFGLVAVSSGKPPEETRELALTQTGTVMGTPRYMAPEQHLGEDVDPRTDQFAFCVALYEALWGRPPFAGDTYGALADAVLAGEVAPPPPSDVPSRIRAAILRGLSRSRADRWPSMTALLAELAPRARRPRWAIAAAVATVAAGAITLAAARGGGGVRDGAAVRDARIAVAEAFDRAQRAYEQKDYAAAAEGFRHAFELDPNLGDRGAIYLYDMAAAYEMVGNCVEAARAYRRYLALATDARDRDNVEAHLQKLAACSETAEAAYIEGEAAYNRGDFAAAIAAFKRGFALAPNLDKHSAAYLYDLAQAYRQLHDCANAATALEKYLALRDDIAPDTRAHIAQMIAELDECTARQAAGSATR
jgi:tetratricopeptide (TPR) repeat protein